MNRTVIAAVGLLVFGLVFGSLSMAQMDTPFPPKHGSYEGIPYITGGVGLGERDLMNGMARDFNLKLSFATSPSGKYLSDVQIVITGAGGATVFEAVSEGPWLFTRLPAGHYSVTATAEGKTLHQDVRVMDSGLAQANIFWKESKVCLLNGDRICGG
jgi:hypothetical protein